MAEFLATHDEAEPAARPDGLYTEEPSALYAAIRRAQSRTLQSERW